MVENPVPAAAHMGSPAAPAAAHGHRQAGRPQRAGFNECLKNQQVLDGIEDVRQRAAQKFNVQSTPTFFVNGKQLRGSATLAESRRRWSPISRSDQRLSSDLCSRGAARAPPLAFLAGERHSWVAESNAPIHSPTRCGPLDPYDGNERCAIRFTPTIGGGSRAGRLQCPTRRDCRLQPGLTTPMKTHTASPARISSPSSSRPIS